MSPADTLPEISFILKGKHKKSAGVNTLLIPLIRPSHRLASENKQCRFALYGQKGQIMDRYERQRRGML